MQLTARALGCARDPTYDLTSMREEAIIRGRGTRRARSRRCTRYRPSDVTQTKRAPRTPLFYFLFSPRSRYPFPSALMTHIIFPLDALASHFRSKDPADRPRRHCSRRCRVFTPGAFRLSSRKDDLVKERRFFQGESHRRRRRRCRRHLVLPRGRRRATSTRVLSPPFSTRESIIVHVLSLPLFSNRAAFENVTLVHSSVIPSLSNIQ